jgi:hypothetical protein
MGSVPVKGSESSTIDNSATGFACLLVARGLTETRVSKHKHRRLRRKIMKKLGLMLVFAAVSGFAGTASAELGSEGQFAISSDATVGIEHHWYDDEVKATGFGIHPALDYFVMDYLSIGGSVTLAWAKTTWHGEGKGVTGFGIGPRVGYAFPIADDISIWPKVSLDLMFSDGDNTIELGVFAPVTYSITDSFFVGLGPVFSTMLSGDKDTGIGLNSVIGGNF